MLNRVRIHVSELMPDGGVKLKYSEIKQGGETAYQMSIMLVLFRERTEA